MAEGKIIAGAKRAIERQANQLLAEIKSPGVVARLTIFRNLRRQECLCHACPPGVRFHGQLPVVAARHEVFLFPENRYAAKIRDALTISEITM